MGNMQINENEKITQETEKQINSINIKKALQEFDNDLFFYKSISEDFLNSTKNKLIELEELINKQKFTDIFKHAHTIKGGAANIMAEKSQQYAENLEKAGRDESLKNCHYFFSELKKEIEKVEKIVNSLV